MLNGTPIGPGFFIFFQYEDQDGAGGQITEPMGRSFPAGPDVVEANDDGVAIALSLLLLGKC